MKSPMAVKKFTTPMAIPFVSVGRMNWMIEYGGSLRLRQWTGLRHDRINFQALVGLREVGKRTDTTGSTAISAGAFPALLTKFESASSQSGPC
jgi:hypothetical protein